MRLRVADALAGGRPLRLRQRWVGYEHIAQPLKQAVLVGEDARFWQHDGVDYEELRSPAGRIGRAGGSLRGASTLTQQLAKNLYLSPSRTPHAKVCGAAADAAPGGRAAEAPNLRAVSQPHRMGRRRMGRRSCVAHILRHAGQRAVRPQAALLAGGDRQPSRVQSGAVRTPGCCGASNSSCREWAIGQDGSDSELSMRSEAVSVLRRSCRASRRRRGARRGPRLSRRAHE